MDYEGYKEVYYNMYCNSCVHKAKKNEQSPCDECLDEPINYQSHKPIKYKKKDMKR